MKLIIAEKPSLARSVAKVIGVIKDHKLGGYIECKDEYIVTWVFGHILELAEPQDYDEKYKLWKLADLPIRPNDWKLSVKDDAKDQFQNIKTLLKQATTIINCGDPDREGQLLVDELLIHLKSNKPTKRLLILDPKDAAIKKALENMEDNSKYYSWYQAGLLRSQSDWLIGMNFTRAFTHLSKLLGGSGVVSVGRVQTPTLKLIYDRHLAISNFKPLNYYSLIGSFKNTTEQEFTAKLDLTNLGFNLDEQGRLLDDISLQNIMQQISGQTGTICQYETKECETQPPLTFKLSDLQAAANAKLGYSVDDTLKIAQTLYEKQLTTYPRSACPYLPESLHVDAKDVLDGLAQVFTLEVTKADSTIKSRVFNDEQLGGESHFAIIPTGVMTAINSLSDSELALYKLIALQYLAQFYPNMKYNQTEGVVQVINKYNFKFSGRVTKSLGWKELFSREEINDDSKDGETLDVQKLPPLVINEAVEQISAEIKTITTAKAKPYTEGSLVKTMTNIHNELENIVKTYYNDPIKVEEMVLRYKKVLKDTAGLGTEATRSSIITTLKNREFIELKGKNIQITNKGKTFMELLTNQDNLLNFSVLTSPLTTAMYEQQLDGVLNHTFTAEQFNKNLDDVLHSKLEIIKTLISTSKPIHGGCPECGSLIVERKGKFGLFKSCSNYPDCTWLPEKPKTGKSKAPADVLTTSPCPKCGQMMIKKPGKNNAKSMLSCSGFPKCKHIAWE